MDVIRELLVTEAAADKLGARRISIDETQQLVDNRYVIAPNPGRRRRRRKEVARRVLIGHTNGGRTLTLVVERTNEPTTWIAVTGWPATKRERKLLETN